MPFSISFPDEPIFYDEQTPMATAELILGDYRETICASLFQWSKSDYESQWRHAIRTLLNGSNSALLVHYVTSEFADNFECWKMYREGQVIYFQNQLPWYAQLKQPFSPDDTSSFVGDRVKLTGEGHQISEWTVPLCDIEDFAKTIGEGSVYF